VRQEDTLLRLDLDHNGYVLEVFSFLFADAGEEERVSQMADFFVNGGHGMF